MKPAGLFFLLAFAAVNLAAAETTEVDVIADPAVYGDYPKNYQEIITNWLTTKLVDAPSAQIQWLARRSPPIFRTRMERSFSVTWWNLR